MRRSLALLVPVITRGLRERKTDLKKKVCCNSFSSAMLS